MSEKIVEINGIQPKGNKSNSTASSGIGNAQFEDFVKNYNKKHESLMNLVATTSTNASSIYRSILSEVKSIRSTNISFASAVSDILSTNNAVAQQIYAEVQDIKTKVTGTLNTLGDIVLEASVSKVNPDVELAKQIWAEFVLDNKSYINKIKLEELDDILHPSKKKKNVVSSSAPGSSVAAQLAQETQLFQKDVTRYLSDIYKLGDLWSDSSVKVASSLSNYASDIYALFDLYTDEQSEFNRKVLEFLGNYDDKLKIISEKTHTGDVNNVTQSNQQKFGIRNKQTNIGVDQSVKLNYTGNIDVRAIKELLESKAIFNPAKIAMIKVAFKSVATSIAEGLQEIRKVLKPEKLGEGFDDPMNTIKAATDIIGKITELASLSSNTATRKSTKSLFGFDIMDISKEVSIISSKNTKKLKNFIKGITDSLRDGFAQIKAAAPDKEVADALSSITEVFSALTNVLDPGTKERNLKLFGKELFSFSSSKNLDKEMKRFNKRFENLTDIISDLFKRLKKISIPQEQVEGISQVISTIFEAIASNDLQPKKAIAFRIVSGGLRGFFKTITSIEPDVDKSKNIALVIDTVLGVIGKHDVKAKHALNLGLIGLGISAFFKITKGLSPDLKTYENVALSLDAVLGAISKNRVTPKDALVLPLLAGGLWLLNKSIASFGKAAMLISKGQDVLVSLIKSISEHLGTNRVKRAANSMKVLSIGIATLGISLVAFAAISPMAVIAAGVLVLFSKAVRMSVGSKKTTLGLALFTTSLAMLGVSLWAFSEVAADYLPSIIGGLALLAGAVWLFAGGGKFMGVKTMGKPPYKLLGYLAAGLATLGLAIWAWQELGITGEGMLLVCGGLAMLAGTTWAMSKIKQTSFSNMALLAAAVGVLGGALWLWEKANISWETIKKVSVAMLGLTFSAFVVQKVPMKAGAAMNILAVGVAVLGGSLWVWQKANITWDTCEIAAVGVAGLAIAGLMFSAVPMTAGVSMILMSAGVAALGGAMWIWVKSGVTWDTMEIIGTGVAGLVVSAYLMANPIALLGAASMVVLGVGLIAIAKGFEMMMKANIDIEKTQTFASALNIVTNGMASLVVPAALAMAASVMLLPVFWASRDMANLFFKISLIKINQNRIKIFGNSVKELVNLYDSFGLIKVGKAAAKALAIIPVAHSSFWTAIAIRMVAALNIDKDRIEQNAEGMSWFINKMVDVFASAGDKVKKTRAGVKAVSGLAGTIKSLADAVLTVSKMEYTENEVRDGKIVPVRVVKLTEKDFQNVGNSIGKILSALTEPLIVIGSQQQTYKLGKWTITNPFGSGNKVKKGIEAIKNIGQIFTPLAEVVKSITGTGIFKEGGDKIQKTLQDTIGGLLSALGNQMKEFSALEFEDSKGVEKTIKSITGMFKPMGDLIAAIGKSGILAGKVSKAAQQAGEAAQGQGQSNAQDLNTILTGISSAIVSMVQQFSQIQDSNSIKAVSESVGKLITDISKANANPIIRIRQEIDAIYAKLKDVKPWNTFRVNLREYERSTGRMVNHINGLELEKAVLLADMVKDLKDADENGNIERLIEKIKELIGQMKDNQETMQQVIENQSITNETENTTTITKDGKQVTVPQKKETREKPESNAGILTELRKISSRLNSRLIVAQATGDVWRVRE